eukprot:CAMPEP_0117466804 /NCGR_PEP_ID=MMETSP0784-20121206/5330_1 /TAXON_ID=39447 /ORGANISM="" /LENGTH=45 /DNA_ID= /DNA_START= /DNA_END= /DNA_ORIENTATION=
MAGYRRQQSLRPGSPGIAPIDARLRADSSNGVVERQKALGPYSRM